jgi:hypothetical protein
MPPGLQIARYNFTGQNAIKKGATVQRLLRFKHPNGQLYDFTGASAKAQLRKTTDPTISIDFVCTFDADRTKGELLLTLPSAATVPDPDTVGTGRFLFDLLIVLADGIHWYPLEGDADVTWRATVL